MARLERAVAPIQTWEYISAPGISSCHNSCLPFCAFVPHYRGGRLPQHPCSTGRELTYLDLEAVSLLENTALLDRTDRMEARPSSLPELPFEGLPIPCDLWTEIAVEMDPLDIIMLSQASIVTNCGREG
jgi:hypothetical protein